jgi:hypothetical protein
MIRTGGLKAARRGRHFHIERDQIDAARRAR